MKKGFAQRPYKPVIYKKRTGVVKIIICLSVDDLLFISSEWMFNKFKQFMLKEFQMKDCEIMFYFLDINVWQQSEGIFISQMNMQRRLIRKIVML